MSSNPLPPLAHARQLFDVRIEDAHRGGVWAETAALGKAGRETKGAGEASRWSRLVHRFGPVRALPPRSIRTIMTYPFPLFLLQHASDR
jgi:hypothetical protein